MAFLSNRSFFSLGYINAYLAGKAEMFAIVPIKDTKLDFVHLKARVCFVLQGSDK